MSSHNVFGVISLGVAWKPLFGQMITGLSQTVTTQDSDFTWEWSVSNVPEISLCMSSAERRQTIVVIYHYYTVMTLYINPAAIVLFLLPYVCFMSHQNTSLYLHCTLSKLIQVYLISRTRILTSAFYFGLLSSLSYLAAKTALSKDSYIERPLASRATTTNEYTEVKSLALCQGI